MQLPLHLDPDAGLSLQLQVFDQIRRLILDGRLRPGARLPASRLLAADLGVSRNTVVLAYERLTAEGYLEMRQPVGTFVSSNVMPDTVSSAAPPVADEDDAAGTRRRARLFFRGQSHVVVSPYDKPVRFDFWVGRPDARLFPIKDWVQIMRMKLNDMQHGNSSYGHPAGLSSLRQAVADYVGAARGIKTSAGEVIIVNGIQEGLSILAQLFVRQDTGVALENPCYLGAANVFASHGARLYPAAIDRDGVIVEDLSPDAALVYLTPSHQYPSGATLSLERRAQLLEWAEHNRSYILEDDYDSDFYYDQAPLPALKSQDTYDQVIYLGTFSKSLGAGLRMGYMIVPRHLVAVATAAKGLLNNCSAWAVQALLADFLSTGAYQHHLRRIRTIYAGRRDCLVASLAEHFDDSRVSGGQSGMHLTWRLPPGWPSAFELERRMRARDVGIYSFKTGNSLVSGRAASTRYAHTVMLGYAALSEAEIVEGIGRLASVAAN